LQRSALLTKPSYIVVAPILEGDRCQQLKLSQPTHYKMMPEGDFPEPELAKRCLAGSRMSLRSVRTDR